MAHDLTETLVWGDTVTVPDDGDAEVVASVNGAFSTLANRAAFLRGLINQGWMLGGRTLFSPGDGSVVVGKIAALAIGNEVMSYPGGTVAVSAAESPGIGNTGGLGWWYLYARVSSGALAFRWSQVAPEASLTWRSNALGTERYIGCAFATAPGVFRAFRMAGGRYVFLDAVLAFNANAPSSMTSVSFSDIVPPHARLVRCASTLTDSGGATSTVSCWLRNGSAPGAADRQVIRIEPGDSTAVEYQGALDSSRAFQFYFTAPGWSGTLGLRPSFDIQAVSFDEALA